MNSQNPGKPISKTATYILRNYPISPSDAARLVAEMLEMCPCRNAQDKAEVINHCRNIIHEGTRYAESHTHTVLFRDAVYAMLSYKPHLRERTRMEVNQIVKRITENVEEWNHCPMSRIDAELCQRTILSVFNTASMHQKARRVMHSVFSFAVRNRWCRDNPVDLVAPVTYEEKPIHALSIEEVHRLLRVVQQPLHAPCAAAVGIMLWAGVRPGEVVRLKQGDINFEDRVITVPARHAKTGGARHVNMYPVLHHWLRRCMRVYRPEASIVPGSWSVRWPRLRTAAGFECWVPDVLRHTFASYHLKHFKDLHMLQVDMGHATQKLLYTRYLAMEGITVQGAKLFWNYGLHGNDE